MASLSSFEEIMEFRLAELRSQLAAEHQLALQQAVGYHSKQLALENSLLRSEVEALRQRVVGGPAVDPFAGKNRPLRSERVPGSPIVFAELLQELYAEEEPLEQLSDLLEDKMLFCLYCAQRNCQEVFRVPFGRRKAKRAPGGHAVARTASSSSLVSNRSSEAKWIAIAEPGSRRSLGQPPDASPLGRSCSAPAAGSRLSTASELDELEAFPLEISPTSQEPLSTSSSRVAALAGVLEEPRSPARGQAPAAKEAPSSSPKEALGSDEGTPAVVVESTAEAQQGPAQQAASKVPATEPGSELAQPDRSPAQEALQAEACPASPQLVGAEPGSENTALAETELKSSAPTVAPEAAPDTGPQAEPAKEAEATVTVAVERAPAPEPAPEPAPPTPEPAPRIVEEEPAPEVVDEVLRKVPALADVLRWAKPSWTPKERAGAQAKLGKVGVQTSEDLLRSLVRAQLADKLNERLREAGLTVFSSATLQALTQTLHEKLPPHVLGIDTTAQDGVQANGDEFLMGFWVGKDDSASYEIRSMQDGGFPGEMSTPDGLQGRGLWYCRRLAQGQVQAGPLQSREGTWPWEVPLQDGSRLRFQLQKSGVMVCERQLEESAAWKPHGSAERPQAYAWFNTYDQKEGHRYIHLPEAEGSSDFPMIGLTAGWVPASLPTGSVNSNRNALNETTMRLIGTFCDPFDVTPQQTLSSQVHELASLVPSATTMQRSYRRVERQVQPKLDPAGSVARHYNIPVQQLRERTQFRGKSRAITNEKSFQDMSSKMSTNSVQVGTSFPPPRPTLSIICVRWYNYWSDPKNSSDYNVLNDGFFTDLLSGPNSPTKVLPGQVEIYTVFIRNTSDLLKLRPTQLRTMLKGQNVTCWYFLWPNCDGLPGEVGEREFFRLCQNMERLPIRSGWPHQSHLYRTLCGKHWMPQMSLNKDFRVPPATRVNYAHFKENPQKTAERALAHLVMLKRKVWGEDVDPEEFKGVVKMGYSWGGCDVLPFKGINSLQRMLGRLFCHKSCQKESCLVQECVGNVIGEVRYIVMQDQFRGSMRTAHSWMQNGIGESFAKHNIRQSDVPEFVMATHFVIEPTEVCKKVFGGHRPSLKSVEAMAQSTVDCWMRWFQTESQFPPQTTRIDFIVSRSEKGLAVWTCEVGENGASLCSVEIHGRNVAALNRAVIREDNRRFPCQFPDKIARNNGEKG